MDDHYVCPYCGTNDLYYSREIIDCGTDNERQAIYCQGKCRGREISEELKKETRTKTAIIPDAAEVKSEITETTIEEFLGGE
jgi:hypothetical protein